ncbi:hypothetical protein Ciccas_005677 [Cichlidogyrus casuarinus]|uniref:RING-type domain-containing protein n=1 Tax=Cichlidogyrus casuarinus TaxID=1844966 RepID=A0ABD2Q7Z2_9PLAT
MIWHRHYFHKNCIDPWLLEQRSCPMCKLDILHAYGLRPDFNCGPNSGPMLSSVGGVVAGAHSGNSMVALSQQVSPTSSQPSLNTLVIGTEHSHHLHHHHLYQPQASPQTAPLSSPFSVLVAAGNILPNSATTTLST